MIFEQPAELRSEKFTRAGHRNSLLSERPGVVAKSLSSDQTNAPQHSRGVDSFVASAPNVVSNEQESGSADAPFLPDPIGPSADPATVRRSVNQPWLIEGFSAYSVLQTLTDNSATNMKLSHLIKRARTMMQFQARTRELAAKGEEITGQNRSATWQFVGSMAGASMSLVAAWSVGFQDVIIGQTISGITNIADQRLGGRAQANVAALEQKQEVNTAQLEQTRVDAASAWYEQVKEARKNAQQAIMTHIQMVGEAVNTVWR